MLLLFSLKRVLLWYRMFYIKTSTAMTRDGLLTAIKCSSVVFWCAPRNNIHSCPPKWIKKVTVIIVLRSMAG